MEFEITVVGGPDEGKKFTQTRSVDIGQDTLCDINLDDATLAPYHSRIDVANGRLFVKNLQPTAKTRVNHATVLNVELNDGDVVSIGETDFRISLPESAQAPARTRTKSAARTKTNPKRPKLKRRYGASLPNRSTGTATAVPQQNNNGALIVISLGFAGLLAFIGFLVLTPNGPEKPVENGAVQPAAIRQPTARKSHSSTRRRLLAKRDAGVDKNEQSETDEPPVPAPKETTDATQPTERELVDHAEPQAPTPPAPTLLPSSIDLPGIARVTRIGDNSTVIRLPRTPMLLDKSMKVGILDLHEVFVGNGSTALIADATVKGVGSIERIEGRYCVTQKVDAAIGQAAVFRRNLTTGRHYIVLDDPGLPKLVYQHSFDGKSKVGVMWESAPGALQIEGNSLRVMRYLPDKRMNKHPKLGMLRIRLQQAAWRTRAFDMKRLGEGSFAVEFNLSTKTGVRIFFDKEGRKREVSALNYVIGQYKTTPPGIYLGSKLIRAFPAESGEKHHVIIRKTPRSTELVIDHHRDTVVGRAGTVTAPIFGFLVFSESDYRISDFWVWDVNPAPAPRPKRGRIAALNLSGSESAVLKGSADVWQGDLLGYWISTKPANRSAVIAADLGRYLICAYDKPISMKTAVQIALEREFRVPKSELMKRERTKRVLKLEE